VNSTCACRKSNPDILVVPHCTRSSSDSRSTAKPDKVCDTDGSPSSLKKGRNSGSANAHAGLEKTLALQKTEGCNGRDVLDDTIIDHLRNSADLEACGNQI
jgi:hypothetical protein